MAEGEDELAQLIERAVALADELNLDLVSARLDLARLALTGERLIAHPPSRLDDLVGSLPNSIALRGLSGSNVVKLHKPTSLERLLDEHEALEKKRISLLRLAEGSPNPVEAEKQLEIFGAHIQAHRANERRCVYGPLMRDEVNIEPGLEDWLRSLVGQIETDWESYLKLWDQNMIAERWTDFALATHSTLARAGERMRLEEKVIYPLAFSSGLLLLRDPAQ